VQQRRVIAAMNNRPQADAIAGMSKSIFVTNQDHAQDQSCHCRAC
jgi:hypothetical protein